MRAEPPRAIRRLTGDHVVLYVNPSAGASRKDRVVADICERLRSEGLRAHRVHGTGALRRLAGGLAERGVLRCVAAVGGDGTFNAVLNETPPGTPLLTLPTGTENLLAGFLRHTRRASDVASLVRDGVVAPLDAGAAGDRLFCLMASIGIDADIVRRVHRRRTAGGVTRNISHLAYAEPIFRALGAYGHPRIRLLAEDASGRPLPPIEGSWLFAINVPRYASGLRIAPRADGADGLLDLCCFRRGDAAASLWYLWNVLRRRHDRLGSVDVLRATRCRVEPVAGVAAPYQVDGEYAGRTPVTLSVAPGRLSVVVSTSRARKLLGYDEGPQGQASCPNLTPTRSTLTGGALT